MFSNIYNAVLYKPLYNGLIFLLSITPAWFSVGLAIIIFTLIVKLVLFPLSKASIRNQIQMKELEPKIAEIKQKFKNPQEQSAQIMAVYKKYNLNPLSGIFLVLIQAFIIFALYRIFLSGGLPTIHADLLYSFVHIPTHPLSMHLFTIDITKRSILFAFLAALTQFFQIRLSIPEIKTPASTPGSMKQDFARTMNMQMRYVLPAFVFVIAYSINAAIALYWITSNIFAICQELFVRRKLVDQSNQRLKETLIVK